MNRECSHLLHYSTIAVLLTVESLKRIITDKERAINNQLKII